MYYLLTISFYLTVDKVQNGNSDLENNAVTNSLDFVWGTTTVAVGDTAVLHCSFDAIFRQLRNGNVSNVFNYHFV